MIVIPYKDLSSDALRGLLEEYIFRDGTDYGVVELSLETKLENLYRQLERKDIVIVFDEILESCNVITKNELSKAMP